MVSIKKHVFHEKFTEVNLRQRIWEKESIVSVIIRSELFPTCYLDSIVSGAVEVVFDCEKIHSLDDLSLICAHGKIGKITISICKDGIWEHKMLEEYEIKFGKREGNQISISVVAEDLNFEVTATLVSLYTTSTKNLSQVFDMKDFYGTVLEKEIGKSKITKYIVKE